MPHQHHHHHHTAKPRPGPLGFSGSARGMSRASSLQSFLDPTSPLSIPALDGFLRAASSVGAATTGTRTPPPQPIPTAAPPAAKRGIAHLDPTALYDNATPTEARGSDADLSTVGDSLQEPFTTSYFKGKPTAEAFAKHRAERMRDARRRLRDVQRAEAARQARLDEIRVTQFARDSRRAHRLARTERRHEDMVKNAKEALATRQERAEQRRLAAQQARAEAQRQAEAHRLEVRARYCLLTEANAVVRDPTCRAACQTLASLSHRLNAAFHEAAESHCVDVTSPDAPPTNHDDVPLPTPDAPPTAAPPAPDRRPPFMGVTKPFVAELHGRMAQSNLVEAIEHELINDPVLPCPHCCVVSPVTGKAPTTKKQQPPTMVRPVCPKTGTRHAQRLPAAAGDLLDALLAGAALPATPEASPSKPPRTANTDGPPSPLRLDDADENDDAAAVAPHEASGSSAVTTPATRPAPTSPDRHSETSTIAAPQALSPEYVQQMTSWARLEDPSSRDLVCRQLIGAHHAAAEYLNPSAAAARKLPDVPSDSECAAYGAQHVLGGMAVTLVRELHTLIAHVTSTAADTSAAADGLSARVHHRRVVRLLGAWDAYCVAAVEEELRKKRAMVAHVTDALVQLRLAEHDRAADIRGRSLAATIAGPNSAQARRERAVAPRRAALTSAVSSQVQSLIRKLRMLGGDRAVAAAEAKAKEAVAAKVKETSRVTELPSDVPTAPVAAA